jgi:N-acetylglutamate synthase
MSLGPMPGGLETAGLGTTVTLAVSTPVGPISVVGVLVDTHSDGHSDTWSVRRRDGSVSVVDLASITAGRVVPPSRAALASVEEVQRIAALGWRPLQTARLGDWLLRASGGFTGRGNSALVLGDPGRPLDEALDTVVEWYAGQGLTARLQVPSPGATPGLLEVLDRRGWGHSPPVHVMTGELAHALRAATGSTELELRLEDAPDAAWLGCYRQDGGALPTVARDLLTNHPAAVFASVRDGDRAVAIARAAVDDRWAGLFAVEVAPDARRRGLGGLVSAAALRWAGQRGARRTYLQVSESNTGAVTLYERLGYAVHHGYVYREAPSPEPTPALR